MALDFAAVLSAISTGTDVASALVPLLTEACKREPEAVRARIFDRQTASVRKLMAKLGRVMEALHRDPDDVSLQLKARGIVTAIVATAQRGGFDVDVSTP